MHDCLTPVTRARSKSAAVSPLATAPSQAAQCGAVGLWDCGPGAIHAPLKRAGWRRGTAGGTEEGLGLNELREEEEHGEEVKDEGTECNIESTVRDYDSMEGTKRPVKDSWLVRCGGDCSVTVPHHTTERPSSGNTTGPSDL
ncbi:hypothetical protein RRG08_043832 [Elysia crispata]|uniref:Uncharacterized protein n=1 Tax=Elysia crispata TaxID=231223 RepID=A0AAE1B604_9GAST|nr:hypothetical protein RRG08_043832 [Elysia crispata]